MNTFRRLVAVVLTITMLFPISTTAFAAEKIGTSDGISVSSFIDGEGKVNTVHVSSNKAGTVHVDYYIDGILLNTVDVEILDEQELRENSSNSTGSVRIKYTDVVKSEIKEFTDLITNYIAPAGIDEVQSIAEPANRGYTYQGKINYKTYYDGYGFTYTDSLSIYQETGSTTYKYKTINAEAGSIASIVIGVIAAVLTVICPALEIVATSLLHAAAYAVGTSIVAGIVQGAITKQYYVRTTDYNIKACDTSTSREQIYSAERYQVALTGGGYSSEYYYEGYLPWNTNAVAYWMFCDFWSYQYPGVSSYS